MALVLATVVALLIGAPIAGASLAVGSLMATAVMLTAYCVAVAGYSVLFSSLSSTRGRAAGMAIAVTVASYLIWILSGLQSGLQWIENLSFFTAYQPQQALMHGTISLGAAALAAIGVLSSALALVIFQRRDMLT